MPNYDPVQFPKKPKSRRGRPPGSQNVNTQMLKDALLLAAEQVGEIRKVPVLDADGNPTGEFEFEYSGVDGLLGYLRWAAINRPASFLALLGRVLPLQLNIKSERKRCIQCTRGGRAARGASQNATGPLVQESTANIEHRMNFDGVVAWPACSMTDC